MRRSLNKLNAEWWLFTGMALLNALPLLVFAYYPGLDAPAHLYNAGLLSDILHTNSPLREYFALNFITTNWLDHVILALLSIFLPSWLALKTLQIVLVVGLAFAFRHLVITLKGRAGTETLLILPFAYTFPFLLGFYNFILGIIVSLLLFASIEKYRRRGGYTRLVGTALMFLLLWLAHAFVFLCFGLSLVILSVSDLIEFRSQKGSMLKQFQTHAWLLLAALPALVLCFDFFILKTHGIPIGTDRYLGESERLSWLLFCRPLVLFNSSAEKMPALAMGLLVIFLATRVFYDNLKRVSQREPAGSNFSVILNRQNRWLLPVAIFLGLFFILPDYRAGQGGHISVRVATFLFILILIWLCTHAFSGWINRIILLGVLGISIGRFVQTYEPCRDYSNCAEELSGLSHLISPYSAVMTKNYSDNWVYLHLPDYAGVRTMAVIDNYEADTRIFPLRWKSGSKPLLRYDNGGQPCFLLNDTLSVPVEALLMWDIRTPGALLITDNMREAGFRTAAISASGNALLMLNVRTGKPANPGLTDLVETSPLRPLQDSVTGRYAETALQHGQFLDCFRSKVEYFERKNGLALRGRVSIKSFTQLKQDELFLVASLSYQGKIVQYQAADMAHTAADSIFTADVFLSAPPSTPGGTEIKIYLWNPQCTTYSIRSIALYRWNIPVTERYPE